LATRVSSGHRESTDRPGATRQAQEEDADLEVAPEYLCEFVGGVDQMFPSDLIKSTFDAAVKPLWTPDELLQIAA